LLYISLYYNTSKPDLQILITSLVCSNFSFISIQLWLNPIRQLAIPLQSIWSCSTRSTY